MGGGHAGARETGTLSHLPHTGTYRASRPEPGLVWRRLGVAIGIPQPDQASFAGTNGTSS
jgi:hypothetical protein